VLLERVAQDLLAAEGREELTLGARQIDVRRRDVDARRFRWANDVGQCCSAVGEDVGHRSFDSVQIDAETRGQVCLRIHVDAEDAKSLFFECPR